MSAVKRYTKQGESYFCEPLFPIPVVSGVLQSHSEIVDAMRVQVGVDALRAGSRPAISSAPRPTLTRS